MIYVRNTDDDKSRQPTNDTMTIHRQATDTQRENEQLKYDAETVLH